MKKQTKFIETMLQEKGLNLYSDIDSSIAIGLNYEEMLKFLNKCNAQILNKVAKTFLMIDFKNGDIKGYCKHIARGMLY